jgi:gliding motility-associated-like protein
VLEIPCGPPYIFLPTSFSPNGDGFNDFFRARTVNVTELYFMVFNRWGEKMYETDEVQHTGWDGQFGGSPALPDSYGWYIRAVCPGQEVYEAKGNVTLLR